MIVIDNFIEKIVPYNEDIFTNIKDYSNKEFLDDLIYFSDKYCRSWKIPQTDFCKGKELFKTFFYFTSEKYQTLLFSKLDEKARIEITNIFKKNIDIVRAQEKLFPDFDYKVICEAIVNILIAANSYELINEEQLNNLPPRRGKDSTNFNSLKTIQKPDIFQFDLKNIENEYYKIETIEGMKLAVYNKKKVKGIWFTANVLILSMLGALTLFRPKLGKSLIAFDLLLSFLKNMYFESADGIFYRYIYWLYILSACYGYFKKNILE